MPVPVADPPSIIPPLTRSRLLRFRFSEWYPVFKRASIRGTVFKFPVDDQALFTTWFEEDGMRLPEGVLPPEENDDDYDDSSSTSSAPPLHSLPSLTSYINYTFNTYSPSGVFPKLNSTCPQDAQWILPFPLPMKCPGVEDVYMVLKASGLMNGVMDGLDQEGLGDGEEAVDGVMEDMEEGWEGERLELVLKKWYDLDRSREFRLFVRGERLIGACQRDSNYYEHLLDPRTQAKIHQTLLDFFQQTIRGKFAGGPDYVVDVYLTSDLSSAHIVDFSVYHPFHTSPLLFSYEDLHELYLSTLSTPPPLSESTTEEHEVEEEVITTLPKLLMIPSRAHPMAARNAPAWPAYPVDVNCIGGGRDIEEFKKVWEDEVREAARE